MQGSRRSIDGGNEFFGAVFAEVAAGFGATAARYADEQLQAYIAIQGEFNRTALDLTRSIAGRRQALNRAAAR